MGNFTEPTDADGQAHPLRLAKPPLTGEEERTVLSGLRTAKGLRYGSLYCYWSGGRLVCLAGDMKKVA